MDQDSLLRRMTFRSIFVSDVHLGFKGCQAEMLLDFLRNSRCEHLFLIGDIIDVWNMRSGLYWPQSHNDVIRTILGKAKHGTRVVYIPGNHDEVFRDYCGVTFGNLSIHRDYVHRTVDGRRLLLLHGDEFDGVLQCSPWLAHLGSWAYGFLLRLNRYVAWVRDRMGYRYWSLAATLKHKVKNAVNYIADFERVVAQAAQKRGVDGLVCGHIHRPEIREMNGLLYCNDGDWVESCSALVEHRDGRLELIDWAATLARAEEAAAAPSLETAA